MALTGRLNFKSILLSEALKQAARVASGAGQHFKSILLSEALKRITTTDTKRSLTTSKAYYLAKH